MQHNNQGMLVVVQESIEEDLIKNRLESIESISEENEQESSLESPFKSYQSKLDHSQTIKINT